jgi:hypothetical protein
MRLPIVLIACVLGGCAALRPGTPPPAPVTAAAPPAPVVDLVPYLDTLLTVADPASQSAALAGLRTDLAADPSARTTLRLALALGAAGAPPDGLAEARRLLEGLAATPGDLDPAEQKLAAAMAREFEARAALAAEIERQSEGFAARLDASNDAHAKAMQHAAAETARLRRELSQAETKLQAITEMERELLEQVESRPPEAP